MHFELYRAKKVGNPTKLSHKFFSYVNLIMGIKKGSDLFMRMNQVLYFHQKNSDKNKDFTLLKSEISLIFIH
jgi:hypothetical protein